MTKRGPGRPKALQPKVVRITVNLPIEEADILQRIEGNKSLAAAVRECIRFRIQMREGWSGTRRFPDTETTRIRRELWKAKAQRDTPETDALTALVLGETNE